MKTLLASTLVLVVGCLLAIVVTLVLWYYFGIPYDR